jgi:chemotaxis protein methyltransferase CheR
VLNLFHQSILRGGFLALGSKESLRHHDLHNKFEDLEPAWKIYRKLE